MVQPCYVPLGWALALGLICQIVGTSKVCDQSGDRVSKSNKSSHICSMRLKGLLAENKKYETKLKVLSHYLVSRNQMVLMCKKCFSS